MKIFICYARVDRGFCVPFANMIDNHHVWYDARIFAGQNWWMEILRRLNSCDVLIFLISPDSVQSPYCLNELNIAIRLGKRILPVLIVPNVAPPEEIKGIQYADLTEGLTQESLTTLHQALYKIEDELRQSSLQDNALTQATSSKSTRITISQLPADETQHPVRTVDDALIGRACAAIDKGNYDQAVFWIKTAIEREMRYKFLDLQELLETAEAGLTQQEEYTSMVAEYRVIADMFKYPSVRSVAIKSFLQFNQQFPDYDPQNLAHYARNEQNTPPPTPQKSLPPMTIPPPSPKPKPTQRMQRLPLLKWARVKTGGGITAFDMAVFPTTCAQYRTFVNDPMGYSHHAFWDYSPFASDWFEKYGHTRPVIDGADDHPITNVCWFEAMAYAMWLSDYLERVIHLPTQSQWRRAAQGEDGRLYSFGNHFSTDLCNSYESRLRGTTAVTSYLKGASPFGIYDMCGNTWEWCINSDNGMGDYADVMANAPRAIMGGAYNTRREKLVITQNFFIDPTSNYKTIGFRVIALL